MRQLHAFDQADTERYADTLSTVASAVVRSDPAAAARALSPIAGELWYGRLTLAAPAGPGGQARGRRAVPEHVRAEVFMRDRFHCTYCGGRVVPRCILVALSDLFPDELAYHPNYARGQIHPVYWALAPEADHDLAHSRGGTNDIGNLATLHTACNARKSDSLTALMPAVTPPAARAEWDGLLSFYPGIVASGPGTREMYHARWIRHFSRP